MILEQKMPELIIREAIARGLREALDGDPMGCS